MHRPELLLTVSTSAKEAPLGRLGDDQREAWLDVHCVCLEWLLNHSVKSTQNEEYL